MLLAHDAERGEPAVSVPAMTLETVLTGETTVPALAPRKGAIVPRLHSKVRRISGKTEYPEVVMFSRNAPGNILSDAVGKLVRQHVEHRGNGNRTIPAPGSLGQGADQHV